MKAQQSKIDFYAIRGALDIIESNMNYHLDNGESINNYDFTVWDVRIRYFG